MSTILSPSPLRRARLIYSGLIALSLLFALLRAGPLHDTVAALILVALAQVALPGVLLARALGRLAEPNPAIRLAWVLVAGIGLVTCLGMIARLLGVPVVAYVVALHALMLALALIRPLRPAESLTAAPWRLTADRLPFYLLLALTCVIVTAVSWERSRFRFSGYEDQTVFVAQAEWLLNDPDDPFVIDRRAGAGGGDPRGRFDGWTYNHATWAWSSGVQPADLIWYYLSPLFAWMVPLAIFALACAATGSERTAALSAGAYTLIGLMTLDTLVYVPNVLAIGQYALVQLNTLRTFSTALLLPLAIFAGLAWMRRPRRADLALLLLAGLALASMHPRQAMLFALALGATAAVWLLARPSWARLLWTAALAVVLAVSVALPYVQRLERTPSTALTEQILAGPDSATPAEAAPAAPTVFRGFELIPVTLPVIGTTRIVNPQSVFYHPAIWLAALLALATIPAWRRSLAAQHLTGATAAALVLLFVPGITGFYIRLVTIEAVWGTIYVIPVALAWGCALDFALRGLQRLRLPALAAGWTAAGALAALMLALLFEPIPIYASARDQISASNQMQIGRDMTDSDRLLVDMLRRSLPADRRSMLLSPNHSANFIIESVPHTFITGGRLTLSGFGTARFFTEDTPPAPWLDTVDLAFMAQWSVTHIVIEADDTRLPQLALQPQRFHYKDRAAGYLLYEVQPDITETPADALFDQMNALYAETPLPRWDSAGFDLSRPGDTERWASLTRQWALWLDENPDDLLALYGLAVTHTMMGADAQALPLWEALHTRQPDVFAFAAALAHTRLALNDAEAAAPLLAALESDDAAQRVLAARELLTEDFFPVISSQPELRQDIFAVMDGDRAAWQQLADYAQPDAQRRRAALLAWAGEWQRALTVLDTLPEISTSPRDLTAAAALALALGDLDGALARLRPAADADWRAPRALVHPDRWQANSAAGAYDLLLGELAQREDRPDDAVTLFRRAAENGAPLAGRYFLARALDSAGRDTEAAQVRAELDALWAEAHDTPFPTLDSLLALHDARALFAAQPHIERGDDETTLTVWASYASPGPHGAYPVQTWRVAFIDAASGQTYGLTEAPALSIDGALVRAPVAVTLSADTPALAAALAFIEPRYNPVVTAPPLTQPVTLNRPASAAIPASAQLSGYRFGDIALEAYDIAAQPDGLDVTLYWRADAVPAHAYQVFVHLMCADEQPAMQSDSAPVNGRYPADQWRPGAIIADSHTLTWTTPPAGPCDLIAGLYRLDDLARLPVTPADARIRANGLLLDRLEP